MALSNWPQLYAGSLADVSDVAEEIGKAQGGYYDISQGRRDRRQKWIGVPWAVGGGLVAYRKSWFAGGRLRQIPGDLGRMRDAGKKLKAKGRPIGQTLGHTFGDAPGFWYPYLWSWGGKEVEADGKTVALNSKETVESVKFAVALLEGLLRRGRARLGRFSSNNRAFLSGTISATNNGASIYLEAKKKPDSYLTEKGTPMKDDILHAPLPKRRRRAVQPARPVHQHADGLFEEPEGGQGFPALDPLEAGLRAMVHLAAGLHRRAPRNTGRRTRCGTPTRSCALQGHPAHRAAGRAMPGRRAKQAAEAQTKYIIVDMYAKAVQGMAAEDCGQMGACRAGEDLRLSRPTEKISSK